MKVIRDKFKSGDEWWRKYSMKKMKEKENKILY